jgi:hypothetical protein
MDGEDYSLLEKVPDRLSANVYVVDLFLWIMGQHGYTLQKSKQQIDDFDDIEHTLTIYKERLKKYEEKKLENYHKVLEASSKEQSNE